MLAVIKTGGKQYLVTPGQELKIEKLAADSGKAVVFDEVLLIEDGEVKIGDPMLKGAKVHGTIVTHGRSPKVIGIKFHNKVRYRRKFGHRQDFTTVKIDKIVA